MLPYFESPLLPNLLQFPTVNDLLYYIYFIFQHDMIQIPSLVRLTSLMKFVGPFFFEPIATVSLKENMKRIKGDIVFCFNLEFPKKSPI